MKIRSGFVSNSSSSSFIIIGKKLKSYDEALEVCKTHEVYAIGEYLSEGADVFECTLEILKYLADNNYDFPLYRCDKFIYDGGEVSVRLNGEYDIVSGILDNSSSCNLDEVMERYT